MSDESKPVIYGPDGGVANSTPQMKGLDEIPPGTEIPPWLPGIKPQSRIVIAGWWWNIEQAVTNGDGQWALILTPIEPSGKTKRAAKPKKLKRVK